MSLTVCENGRREGIGMISSLRDIVAAEAVSTGGQLVTQLCLRCRARL